MRSRQALYHNEQKPWPTALPGLIDAALIKSRASGVQVASGWSDIVLPAVQAADTPVVAEYAHRPSDVVVQHKCNLAYAYELTGWNSSVVGGHVVASHGAAGSHTQPNPLFEQAAGWLSARRV